MEIVREVQRNGGWYGFVAVIGFIAVIGTPYGDPLLSGFEVFQRAEAILINN